MYQNKYDTEGTNAKDGQAGESQFEDLALKKGYKVTTATREQQFQHIDFILEKDNKTWFIDVKAKKKLSRKSEKYNYDWLWMEIHNVKGEPGWIYGFGFVAFEMEDHFLVAAKKDLAALVEKLVDFEKTVDKADKARYSVYRRFKRKDKITLIESKHLTFINHSIWPKTTSPKP